MGYRCGEVQTTLLYLSYLKNKSKLSELYVEQSIMPTLNHSLKNAESCPSQTWLSFSELNSCTVSNSISFHCPLKMFGSLTQPQESTCKYKTTIKENWEMTMFSTFHLPELPSLAPSPCQHSQKPGTSLPISQSNLLIEQQSSASNLKKNLSTNLIQSPTARGLTAPTVSVKLCQDTSFIVSYIILLHCLCLQFSFDHICVSPFPVSMEYSKLYIQVSIYAKQIHLYS